MTEYFAAAEQIDAAQRVMANAIVAIREREGTLAKAAEILGLGIGQARKLVALLDDSTPVPGTVDDDAHGADAETAAGDLAVADQSGPSPADTGARAVSDAATT